MEEAEGGRMGKKTSWIKKKDITDIFNERLVEILGGENKNYSALELGQPSDILKSAGLPDLPIQMSVQRLIDKKLQATHPFKLLSVVHMPDYIARPIAVFQSKTRKDCKVILTEMENEGANIVVVVETNKLLGKINVNSVRSVYPKDNIKDILRWVCKDGLLEYIHKQKFPNWLDKQQSISADVTQLIKDSTKIVQKFENP
jgi:hypothetical protein